MADDGIIPASTGITEAPKQEHSTSTSNDAAATQPDPAPVGDDVGATIHTHTSSEEMTSIMKQMNELQSRYQQLAGANSLEPPPQLPPLSEEARSCGIRAPIETLDDNERQFGGYPATGKLW